MTKRGIFDGWLENDPAVLGRYAIASGDWAKAWAMREATPAPGWRDEDLAELHECNRSLGAGDATLRNVERMADPATRIIVTGQQTTIGLGPLYTLYKALGAILHARQQEASSKRAVVPCFWKASEDHDFEEVRSVNWLGADGGLQSLRYEPMLEVNGRSMADVPIEDSLYGLLDRLEQSTADTQFKGEVLAWLREALDHSSDLQGFFGRAMIGLLGQFGLVVLSPYLMGLRRHAVALFEKELSNPRESSRRVIQAAAELSAAGYAAGLHRQGNEINFFIYENGRRCKLSWDGDAVLVECAGEPVRHASAAELIELVRQSPRKLSTNVISRPVTQDAALSTLAYVAGPGELSYFAQLREVYELWHTPMPMIVPRPRVLLVDARVRRFFEKSGTTLEEFRQNDPKSFFRMVMMRSVTYDAQAKLIDAQKELEATTEKLSAAIGDVSPAVKKAVEKLKESQNRALQTVQERLDQELIQQNKSHVQRLERVEQWLRPNGQPQERVYSALSPLLINYGMQAIDRLLDEIDLEKTDEQVIQLQ